MSKSLIIVLIPYITVFTVLTAWVLAGIVDEISNAIRKVVAKRQAKANRCKGITKQGEQCLNTIDCHYHSN